jgi:type I restriction enzyme S subunit
MGRSERITATIESLLETGAITGHKDGNYGSLYPRADEFSSVGVPFLTAKSLRNGKVDIDNAPRLADERADKLPFGFIQPGDVLLSHNATIGRVAIVPNFTGRLLIGTSLTYFRVNPQKLSPRYLAAYFAGRDFQNQLTSVMSFTTRNQVPISLQRRLKVVVPSLPEQDVIASMLGSLDDKIELSRRMNETLEALAQSLFKSWFVDATANGLPKSWTERALYDCADYINGAAFRNEHFSAERQGLPVIKIGELKDGITAQTKFCEIEREPKYRINSGDVLFSWSGSPDTSIDIFIWTEGEGWLNQHIFKVQFKRPIEKFFVYYLLRHLKPVFVEIARDKQTTGLGHVTGQDLKRLKTFFPTDDILEKFNRVVEPLFQKVYSNLHESRTLAALRDTLLPKLLSGEIRVGEVEQ